MAAAETLAVTHLDINAPLVPNLGGTESFSPRAIPQNADVKFKLADPPPVIKGDPTIGLPAAPHIIIPDRFKEKGVGGLVGNEKGVFVEDRIAKIVALHPKVDMVVLHSKIDLQNGKGHDITVYFKSETGIDPIHIQGKSRDLSIRHYRNKISGRLRRRGIKMTPSEWLILDRTIPINGAVEDEQEILYAFVNGAAKIIKFYDTVARKHKYVELFAFEHAKSM